MRYSRTSQRRAMILMVVLSLLTLFALVGLTFVLYADAEATAARVAREAQSFQVSDMKPEEALSYFLGQFIYDVPDTVSGAGSGIRGHSLARTMYGYFYVSGTATLASPTILTTATGNLGTGAFVMVQSNTSGAVLPAYIAAVVPNVSITLNIPWPFPTSAVTINTDTNVFAYNGTGRLHYANAAGQSYPYLNPPPITTPLQNVPNNYLALPGQPIDDYALVNYTWFSGDGPMRDPERFGSRLNPALQQTSAYVGGNAPYTYPDLNSFFLAAMRADGTVLTPSFHRPWLFQMATVNVGGVQTPKFYAFNDMTNQNWTNKIGKYLTLRPRPAEHPLFLLPGDATGDVKNLPWAPGGNDSIWIDVGAPVMTAPDGTKYKMLFAPLIVDLDGRINLNTAGNIENMVSAALGSMGAPSGPAAWQTIAGAHVSNQGWGPWEVNLSKVLWGDQALYTQTTPPTPPEWIRLFTGASLATTTAPNVLPWIYQPGVIPTTPLQPGLSAWMLPGVRGRYVETLINGNTTNFFSPTVPTPPANIWLAGLGLNGTYPHVYAQVDSNGLNDTTVGATPTPRLSAPGFGGVGTYPFPGFTQGYFNGGQMPLPTPPGFLENTNHPLLYNVFQSPLTNGYTGLLARAFTASDMAFLLRPNASQQGPVDTNAAAIDSDLMRLCPMNFPSASTLALLPPNIKSLALRYRNLVTTQSWDIGQPGVSPYWYSTGGVFASPYPSNVGDPNYTKLYAQLPPLSNAAIFPTAVPGFPLSIGNNPIAAPPNFSEFGLDGRAVSANNATYLPFFTPNPTTGNPNAYSNPVWVWNGTPTQWNLTAAIANPAGYITPGARIRLNRPLPPYPHMGAGLTPPTFVAQPGRPAVPPFPTAYGVAYDLTNTQVANQYQTALNARQALANDIYRRLLLVTGVTAPKTPATPTPQDLAPRRWLAQLAVNIVDYIDEDDIATPFNFYNVADGLLPASIGLTTGGDNTTANGTNLWGTNQTGANPLYWVFGTELPKVVLNEVLAEANNPNPSSAAGSSESVKVWAELYNTMPKATPPTNTQPQDLNRVPLYMTNPKGVGYSPYRITIAQNLQSLPLPPGETSNATYNTLPDAGANVLGQAYFGNANSPNTLSPLPQSTTDSDFLAGNPNPSTVPLIQGGTQGAGIGTNNAGIDSGGFFLIGPSSSGNYPNPFVLANMGNGVPSGTPVLPSANMQYTPTTTSWPSSSSSTYNPDERTNGLTVMLRRLANPYLPFNPNPSIVDPNNAANFIPNPAYNPYVTVDYIPSVPIYPSNLAPMYSVGKRQPYAGLLQPTSPPTVATYPGGNFLPGVDANSPVTTTPGTGAVSNAATINGNPDPNPVYNTFGLTTGNLPLPQSGHYDWLVHLDRAPISPMELLHVSAWPPYMLTQKSIIASQYVKNYAATGTPASVGSFPGSNNLNPASGGNVANALNMFGHYAPWFDAFQPLLTSTNFNLQTMSCPWWFDSTLTWAAGTPNTHRLSRLFEFLECGDRAVGVNGLGRIPGKVNINNVWDPEILHALIDANANTNPVTSMGANTNLPFPPLAYAPVNVNPATPALNGYPWNPAPADLVSQIFANMMSSRSPSYYNNGAYANALRPSIGPVNMGTATADAAVAPPGAGNIWTDDRPFMPLSTGLYLPTGTGYGLGTQFPNGLSVISDTLLRTNNPLASAVSYPPAPTGSPTNNLYLLFQNYYDNGTSAVTPTPQVSPAIHPYLQTQLLNKLYNNVTTRSNTFAIFLTVGFFQVLTDPTTGNVLPALGQPNIPQLGPELGRSEGKQVRHRMFSIVDRTNLATLLTTGQAVPPATQVTGPVVAPLNLTGAQLVQIPAGAPATPNLTVTGSGVGATAQLFVINPITGAPGVIQTGTQLVIDPGTVFEETVTVTLVTPPTGPGLPAYFTANFALPHGVNGTPITIIQRGNPGPWLIPYDPRLDSNVVLYFSIID